MERVTPADAAFLYMENGVVHMHVTGVMILDPSGMDGGFDFETLREHFKDRLHLVPLFRRRLMSVPLGIDHPVWVDDPDFDLDNHLHRHRVAPPGTKAELADFVGTYASDPLDRSKPLWDMVVVEGLEGGRVAVVSKMHHVGIDGVSGTDLMAHLVDLSPEPSRPEGAGRPFQPDAVPSRPRLAVDAVVSRVRDPLRGVRSLGRTATAAGRLGMAALGEDGPSAGRPFDAPRAFFNQSLTSRRSAAFATASLEDCKFIKSTFGVTVNDVFLAACTQSLRSYLLARDGLPHRPLLASVPVSVHGQASDARATNQVSNMFVRLPTNFEDPVEQLRSVNHETKDAKAVHGAMGADMIGDVTELTPPAIFNLASRLYSQVGLAERIAPIHNLVISNVPGPPIPLYVGGARLEAVYPLGPLIEGAGLNITVLSNMGNMDIGVIGCPDIAPDLAEVAEGIADGIRVLRSAAEAKDGAETSAAKKPKKAKKKTRKAGPKTK
ncbi:MAG: wax ester/triacylglycerol synthase family O-acyltransferase [Acidimicrobiales bacterium]|nr:wax ester/triacylglycerol synthase family O-acyltransferase [Acidimicrobiales bacterium]